MLAGAAPAAGPARLDPPGVAEAGVPALQNKLRLVRLLLTNSPAIRRIPQSDNAQAKTKLADAQALYAKAETESRAGRTAAAVALLDEALRQIASASKLAPDAARQAAQEGSRNTELRAAIHTFQTVHGNLAIRMPAKKVQAVAADTGRIDSMVEKADALIAGGNVHEANVLLIDAHKIVVTTLNKMLAAETIVYDLKFGSPADEFRHELARNRGYEELIPIALAQLNGATAGETAAQARRYVQQSRALCDTAQKQAKGNDYPGAVKTLQDATGHLQRSLQLAGVVVPQLPES